MNTYDLIIKRENLPETPKLRFKFTALVVQFIYAAEKGQIITPKGNRYKKSSMRPYHTLILWLRRYEEKFGTVFLDQIDVLWAEYFKTFLVENDQSKNSIAAHLSRLKSILNRAYVAGLTNRTGHGIKCSQEKTEQVYLTINELSRVYHFDFSNSPGREWVRDAFIMNCFLGMRISDLRNFLKDPRKYIQVIDGRAFLNYSSEKTNTKAVIPINSTVRTILENRGYDFGKVFTYQHFNQEIKKICKLADVNDEIICRWTKGGEVREIVKKKHLMVSSHTSRRTFASLAELAKIPRPAIMKMTGHSTENSFLSYIRISELDSAITIQQHPFFKIKL